MPLSAEQKKKYGPGWAEFSRSIRIDRAQGRCECAGECGRHTGRCTQTNKSTTQSGAAVVLTVAHLCHTPQCRSCVKAMCQACHLTYDRNHRNSIAAASSTDGETRE